MYYLYKISRVGTNDSYIGVTTGQPNKRYIRHLTCAKTGSKCHLHRAIRKYGEKSFVLFTLLKGEDEKMAYIMEKRFIALLKPSYNMTIGGEGTPGFKHKEKTKRLYSEMRRGKIPWNKGLIGAFSLSDEAKKKIGDSKRGKKRMITWGDKISQALQGRTITWITRKKKEHYE